MSKRIEILSDGAVVRTIRADESFAEAMFSGAWRLAEEQDADTPAPTPAEVVLNTIQKMEREQLMPRITRESILRLAEKEASEISDATGIDVSVLLSKNKGYMALKAFDNQIAALRAQL